MSLAVLLLEFGICYAQSNEPVVLQPCNPNAPASNSGNNPDQGGPQRSPIFIPSVFLDGYSLLFERCCIGSEIEICQDDEVVYSTSITDENCVVLLPENLSGFFEFRLYWGSHVFVGEFELQ